jgi:hypothetical protein
VLDEFSASLSATLNLTAGLDIFCHGANRLFAADRTSVWIHDRRAHHRPAGLLGCRGCRARRQISAGFVGAGRSRDARSRSEILSPAEGR